MRLKLLLGLITLLLSHFSFAQEDANSSSCQKPSDKNKLFWCLVKNKPEVKLQEIDIKVQEIIGSMNKKQANLYLSLMLKSHKYKELIIENQKFGITNLRGVINWKLDKR